MFLKVHNGVAQKRKIYPRPCLERKTITILVDPLIKIDYLSFGISNKGGKRDERSSEEDTTRFPGFLSIYVTLC